MLNGNRTINKGIGKIIDIKHFTLDKLNNYISFLDTGYPPDECRRILETMYKNHMPPINWLTQEFSLILIVKDKPIK